MRFENFSIGSFLIGIWKFIIFDVVYKVSINRRMCVLLRRGFRVFIRFLEKFVIYKRLKLLISLFF